MTYHIGVSKRGNTAVIEARRNVSFLSCEVCDYLGPRITTKKNLHAKRYELLAFLKAKKPGVYGNCRYIVVD